MNRNTKRIKGGQGIPDGQGLKFGVIGTLPACNASRLDHVLSHGNVLKRCNGTTWESVATTATAVLSPVVTIRSTTGAAIANNVFQSITANCSAGELCMGGGYAAVTSTLVRVSSSYPSSTTAWTTAWTNVSGANAQMTVYAVCAKFGV